MLWRLETSTGAWAVKKLLSEADDADVEAEFAFVEAARAAGVRAPRVVRSVSDEVIVGGIRVYEWIENRGSPSPDVYSSRAGAALGLLHNLQIPATGPPDEWYMRRYIGGPWDSAELARLDELAAQSPTGRWLMCHRDFDPANTLVDVEGNLVLVDWDTAGPLTAESEVGYALLTWMPEPFLEGYASVRAVPRPAGLNAFSVVLAGRLNFLAALLATDDEWSAARAEAVRAGMPTAAGLERVLETWRRFV